MLEQIFWTVNANKIKLFLQKNAYFKYLYIFKNRYVNSFNNSNTYWKAFLIAWPLLNIFIFSWLFSFILCAVVDLIIFIKINANK